MMEFLSLEFELSSDILTTVRLATGGVGALLNFGIDDAEDLKVSVTEALLLLLRGGAKRAKLCFSRGETLGVSVEAECERKDSFDEISVALLSALVEDLSIASGALLKISFNFGRA